MFWSKGMVGQNSLVQHSGPKGVFWPRSLAFGLLVQKVCVGQNSLVQHSGPKGMVGQNSLVHIPSGPEQTYPFWTNTVTLRCSKPKVKPQSYSMHQYTPSGTIQRSDVRICATIGSPTQICFPDGSDCIRCVQIDDVCSFSYTSLLGLL